jgi:hypothetical protein
MIQSFRDTCSLSTGKAKVLNQAIQEIGHGQYQWALFGLCGLGWFADKYVRSQTH